MSTPQDTPFIPAPRITTVAGYLLTRLAEAGLISVFGVPGADNHAIVDAVAGRPELAWADLATELGAGYAAACYARLRGIGALVTTFGAGELSALNAIAGAWAESVPVVHIVGTPALEARQVGAAPDHDMPDRDYDRFARIASEVTAAQADLRVGTAPEEIDRVLGTALRTSRPVYLTIPADVADLPVLAPAGRLPRAAEEADPAVVAAFTGRARRMLAAADSTSLLLGHLADRYRVTGQVRDLAIAGQLPVAVLPTAKGDFPESDPRFAGLYPATAKRARVAVEDTELLITVGVTMTGGVRPEGHRIDLAPEQARIDGTVYPGLGLRRSLAILTAAVVALARPVRSALAELPPLEAAPDVRGGPLTPGSLRARMQDLVRPGDLLIAGAGAAFDGAAALTLPAGARLIAPALWPSAGWPVPAALGASLAEPGRRVVLIAGDTAGWQAELAALLGQGLAPVIIVLGRDGGLACAQPQASLVTLRAGTSHELAWALNAARYHAAAGRPVLVEADVDASENPLPLQELTRTTR